MSVAVGSRLGPYEVVSPLGSGGMGDVYKARDTRLGRSVAIKLLKPQVAEDPEQRRRFEQEARAVSHLSHPGIATVFDIGRHDERDFIVMEFVDGETLADRIRRGPLPVDAALRIAIDVAEALGHAHRAGITHRDLKPPNIILRRSGPKLLDFGLAKLRNQAAEATRLLDRAVAALNAPVRQSTTLHTQHGTILGTFEYMAPEQVEGADVDPRADVFAFGALLYEMITGRRAFEAATQASLIGAILVADPPPLGANRPDVPPLLDLTVRRCLAKDREDRWQSVSDLLFVLRSIAAGPAMQQASTRSRARTVEIGLAVSVLALVVVLSLLWTGDAAISRSTTLWDLALPVGHSLTAELSPSLAISPNGQQIVYGARSGVASQLFVRRADEFEPTPLAGSSDGHTPFFSPDGQWVGFMAKGRILKVPLTGGAPQLVCDAPSLAPGSPGATWGPDNTIVFASGVAGLMRVNAAGGSPELLTTPASDRGEVTHISPQFLPGGQELLFTIRTDDDGWRVAILTIATRQWRLLPSIGEVAGARYAATGHLMYAQSGNLFARPMSIAETSFAGTALPLSADVYTRVVTDALIAQFALSDNGALAFISGQPPDWTLMAVDRAGRELALLADTPKMYRYPRFSPDGHRIAVTVEEQRTDVWIVNEPGSIRKLTKSGSNMLPVWTPKGDRVTFASRRPGSTPSTFTPRRSMTVPSRNRL
jgi:serine/threonine protein kinase/Tol biopolymer transport system component